MDKVLNTHRLSMCDCVQKYFIFYTFIQYIERWLLTESVGGTTPYSAPSIALQVNIYSCLRMYINTYSEKTLFNQNR